MSDTMKIPVETSRQTQVRAAIEQLEGAVCRTESVLAALTDRLSPVLRNEPVVPPETQGTVKEAAVCLAEDISSSFYRVGLLHDSITDILSRLEL